MKNPSGIPISSLYFKPISLISFRSHGRILFQYPENRRSYARTLAQTDADCRAQGNGRLEQNGRLLRLARPVVLQHLDKLASLGGMVHCGGVVIFGIGGSGCLKKTCRLAL